MDYTIPAAIISGGAVITAAILKLTRPNGYLTKREFQIWSEGFEKRWGSLEGWIKTLQADIKELGKQRRM